MIIILIITTIIYYYVKYKTYIINILMYHLKNNI